MPEKQAKSVDDELVGRLLAAAPNWAAVQTRLGPQALLIACPLRASEMSTRRYELCIWANDGRIHVREQSSTPRLPIFCPQRHMNSDGTFCLGLNAGESLIGFKKTRAWWDKLSVFLTCQDTASETRSWPPDIGISHGQAGVIEVQAEDVAEQLGLLEDYRHAVGDNTGIIAIEAKSINKITGQLRNGRSPCVCGRTNKRGYRKLRRECRADGDLCLPLLEAKRRREEIKFWEVLKDKHKCCGTMDDCPLK